jgi:hypothetical protein
LSTNFSYRTLESLRDEYVLEEKSVDPEMLDGTKQPPQAWTNKRLAEMGEKWEVSKNEEYPPIMAAPSKPKARVVFGFYQVNPKPDSMQTDIFVPIESGKIKVSLMAFVPGDVAAENLQIIFRICDECSWISTPNEFSAVPEKPQDRTTVFPTFFPNMGSPKWDFEISLPRYPRYTITAISAYYACANCETIDPTKPQILWVNQSNPFTKPKMRIPQ